LEEKDLMVIEQFIKLHNDRERFERAYDYLQTKQRKAQAKALNEVLSSLGHIVAPPPATLSRFI